MGLDKMFKIMEHSDDSKLGHNSPFQFVPTSSMDSTALTRLSHPAKSLREETLRIATRLRMAVSDSEKSIAFTGLEITDFASTLAQDIAIAFSQFAPGQVLLVAAGAHKDSGEPGLSEVLTGKCGLNTALLEPVDGGPWILPPGGMDSDRSHLYFSAECALLFGALAQRFQHILVDAGPLNSPASLVMVARCDTVTVALAAGPHHRKEVLEVQKELARVKTRMLGVVLTKRTSMERHP